MSDWRQFGKDRAALRSNQFAHNPIGLIGRIDLEETMFDGQTVKTRLTYRELARRIGEENLVSVDTRDYRTRPIRTAWQLAKCLTKCDQIVVSLSDGGRKALFPILALSHRVSGKQIYHNLIGGRLSDDIDHDRSGRLVWYLNEFEVNWVESQTLIEKLKERGVRNAEYLPNFKNPGSANPILDPDTSRPVKLCIFSRVNEVKGIPDAVTALSQINLDPAQPAATLDIFGPVDEDFKSRLTTLLENNPWVQYCGVVSPEAAVETLRGYQALLFPTQHLGEGMPATIIDALQAGLPIIASRWRYYGEMLEDGITGLSYEFGQQERLAGLIREFLGLSAAAQKSMRVENYSRSKQYSLESVFDTISGKLELTRTKRKRVGKWKSSKYS